MPPITQLETNRIASTGANWPDVAHTKEYSGYYSLFLRGKNGHCIKTTSGYDLTIGICWGWKYGVNLGIDDNGDLTDEDGNYLCTDDDAATPSAGATMIISTSCSSKGYTHNSDGTIVHTQTGLYLVPADEASAFTPAVTTSVSLSTTSTFKWGFWKKVTILRKRIIRQQHMIIY